MNMMIILSSWLVIEKWDDAAKLGELMAWVALPMLVLAPFAGVVTDRVDKRKLLLAAQSLLVLTNSVVAALIVTDAVEFWHLRVVYMVSSAAFAFNMPARQVLVAMLVPREKLMNAIALSTAAMNASRIVAPIGIGGAYILSTVFYASAVVAAFALPSMPAKRVREFTFFEDFTGGFAYIRRSSVLVGLLLFATVPMIFAMPYMTLLPVFADRVWHVGSTGFGVLQAASGVDQQRPNVEDGNVGQVAGSPPELDAPVGVVNDLDLPVVVRMGGDLVRTGPRHERRPEKHK